jgi:glycine/D-amino acid oxidase-like deaminating enzyme/nitrite reductase/ring-hydroxylating ferredoxin subunit
MNRDHHGASLSLWMGTADAPALPPLDDISDVQVCIVGAGIAGLSTAYQLAREGRSVLVLDERGLGGGQTARTTGHLCNALDDRYYELERLHGADGARAAAASHAAAIDAIEATCREEGIDCDFARVDGYLVQGRGDARAGILDRELDAASRAGVDCERVPGAPGALSVFGDALRFRNQAQFHALRYQAGLMQAIQRLGGRVYRASVVDVHGGSDCGVTTSEGRRVNCDAVVVATNVPFNDRLAIHTKQAAYRTYVLALRIAPGAVPDALLWDTLDPYHYVRVAHDRGDDWLIVGGEDRKVGQDDAPEARERELELWTREYFPMAGDVGYSWSGQVIETMDALAFIGRNPGLADNVYVVTGDSGNGLTHGTLAGLLLPDLIAGRDVLHDGLRWSELYAANRKNLRATDDYLRENLNFVPYYGELLSGGDVDSPQQLARGEGAIIRDGLHKIAAYRDEGGELHLHSAVCPHLGCVVHFNAGECSWDCPCHGSRFDARDGARLNGPADRGLAPADFAHPAQTSARSTPPGPIVHP